MIQIQKSKPYDLEERTLEFGKRMVHLCRALPKDIVNNTLVDQVIRSGTSIGANYREANETETKKDFQFRMRICRKEAKETVYWLKLIVEANRNIENRIQPLITEAIELMKIVAAILNKAK